MTEVPLYLIEGTEFVPLFESVPMTVIVWITDPEGGMERVKYETFVPEEEDKDPMLLLESDHVYE